MKKQQETIITFVVKFEDGKTTRMTAQQIAELRDIRRYEVLGHDGKPILTKTYRGK